MKFNKMTKAWGLFLTINLINTYICLFESVSDSLKVVCWWFMVLVVSFIAIAVYDIYEG